MLTLPIKKKWFDMILSGEKKEEYREKTEYWERRLSNLFDGLYGERRYVLFRNGYGNDKPTIKCFVEIAKGIGKPEWGAEPIKEYYVLKILSVEEIK